MVWSERPTGEQSVRSKAQESPAAGYGAAWSIFGVLLSGMLAWGGIGWLVDGWLETEVFLPVGLIIGGVGGVYLSYKRFGVEEPGHSISSKHSTSSTHDGDDDNATAKPPSSG